LVSREYPNPVKKEYNNPVKPENGQQYL